jgi:predicted nucleic acid-binding protein
VIALDTNYLINALVAGSPEATALIAWHRNGEVLATPSVMWYEFLCGPVSVREI